MGESGKHGIRPGHLLIGTLGVLIIIFFVFVFARTASNAKTQIIPGSGIVDASGNVMKPAPLYGKAGGRMRGGGEVDQALPPTETSVPEWRPASDISGGFEVAKKAVVSPTNPMLIRTGSMRLRVDDVRKAFDEAVVVIRAANGYLADSNFGSEQGPAYATMTVRLPAEGLDSVIERIAQLGKVLQKQIGAEEVTEEYVDLSSRKRNLVKEEERLLELLKRAGKVSDLLEVEQTVGRVRGEIEQITGRMRYLENRVALSTLTIQFEGPQPQPTAGGPVWTAKDTWRTAVRSLLDTAHTFATMAIWLTVFIPIWLPLLLLLRWLARRGFVQPSS